MLRNTSFKVVFKIITRNGSQWQGRTRMGGGGAQRKCVQCMQGVCGGFGTRRPSSLETFGEKASRVPLSVLL